MRTAAARIIVIRFKKLHLLSLAKIVPMLNKAVKG
jgi:hypothetical protein